MDRQLIKTLIDALQLSELSELEYSSGGETLRLTKGGRVASAGVRPGVSPIAVGPLSAPVPLPAASTAPDTLVPAPLFGVVHLQPAADAAPFVSVGQAVAAGQVLCTVEAMKVFTDVRAGQAGTVEAVLVGNGEEVEPGQALMRVR